METPGGTRFGRAWGWPRAGSATVHALAGLALSACATLAAEPAKKPAVPPGVDPGGVLIALIGEGIDYTLPGIAARLARDGEGEIIGWDFVDDDRRPFGRPTHDSPTALELTAEPGKTRLVVVRSRVHRAEPAADRLIEAIAMAAQSKARLFLLPEGRLFPELMRQASARFPQALFFLPQTGAVSPEPSPIELPNTLMVANSKCGPDRAGMVAEAEIAVDAKCLDVLATERVGLTTPSGETAAARIAALAARISSAEPSLTGAELKQRIIALAKPFPAGQPQVATHGWIEDPSSLYPMP